MFQGSEIIIYWYDYVILIVMLCVSTSIGLYFGIFGKKQSTTEYLMGDKRMKPFPVGCSATASLISTVALIGVPSEVYLFGAAMLLSVLVMTLECLISCTIFLPVLHKLKIKSIYEYLKQRFDEKTRKLIALLFISYSFVIVPGILYITVIILSPAIGISSYSLVPIISGICIFYTTVGGFKTVIWTDTVQLVFIIVYLITFLAFGIKSSNYDLKTIWNKAVEGDRLNIFDFDFDLTQRDSFWALVVGFTLHMGSISTTNQNHMQKILAVETFKESVVAKIYYAIGITINNSLCTLIGLLIYAKYSTCDPVQAKTILAYDQLILLYVTDIAQNIPGFTGLFLAGIVSATLSTQSAILNSVAGVIHEDFVKELMSRNLSEKRRNIVLKLIVLMLGIASTLIVFVIIHFNTSIFSWVLSFVGMLSGAAFGVFTLGILFPMANAKGAFYGSICGVLSTAFVVIPAKYYQYNGSWKYPHKPLSIDNCTFLNVTDIYEVRNKTDFGSTKFLPPAIFRISFYYYSAVGLIVTIVSGLVISYFTSDKNDRRIDKALLSPVIKCLESKKNNTVHENVTYSSIEGALDKSKIISPETHSLDSP